MDMAEKGVIVKKLSSIATFGSVDVLCTDKTGTLTEDKISLVRYTDASGHDDEQVLLATYLNSSLQTGIKNPLDSAVLKFHNRAVIEETSAYVKVDEIPFDFVRKRVSVVVRKGASRLLITKGAPEEVFKVCTLVAVQGKSVRLDARMLERVTATYHDLSGEGHRVLAIAHKRLTDHKTNYTKADEQGLTLLGFVAFLDPPKKGAKRGSR
jgi:Mg2+-importing ATPase